MNEMVQGHWWDWWLLGSIILFSLLFLAIVVAFLIKWKRQGKGRGEND